MVVGTHTALAEMGTRDSSISPSERMTNLILEGAIHTHQIPTVRMTDLTQGETSQMHLQVRDLEVGGEERIITWRTVAPGKVS